jgi:hypothetical protein
MAVKTHTRAASSPPPNGASGTSVRTWLAGLVVLALSVPIVSSVLGLYDRVLHWGKLVHGVDGFLVGLLVGLLLLGWRDRAAVDLADQLAVLLSIFTGILFGVIWEIVAFVIDWVRYSDLQKSNTDTMTNLLWNDVGAVVAAMLAARLYCRALSAAERKELGGVAAWLLDGPSRVLDRHGLLVSIIVAVLAAAAIAAVWFAGRPLPGLAID